MLAVGVVGLQKIYANIYGSDDHHHGHGHGQAKHH